MSYFSRGKFILARLYRSVLCVQSLLRLMVTSETFLLSPCCTEASNTLLSNSSKPDMATYLMDTPITVPMVWTPGISDITEDPDQSSVPIHTFSVTFRSMTNGKKLASLDLLEKTTMVLTLALSMLSTMSLMIWIVSSLYVGMTPW